METKDESMEAVLADLRRWGKCHFARSAKVRHFCDRIEAAWKRESKAIATEHAVLPAVCITKGGDAAMREALAKIAKCMDEILVRTELDSIIHRKALEAQNLADGVLMEPPRNCDVGTAGDTDGGK